MKIEELKEEGIVNGIGAKGGFNFSLFFKNNIHQFQNYIPDKLPKLIADIEELSIPHDISYFNGNTLFKKIIADYTFALGVMKLFHWTNIRNRVIIFTTIFIGLLIFGNKAYNWGEERYIYITK